MKKIIVESEQVTQYPLSNEQFPIWCQYKIDSKNQVYNINRALRLKGVLNIEAIKYAYNDIIRRHTILRARFMEKDGIVYQFAKPMLPVSVNFLNLISKKNYIDSYDIEDLIEKETNIFFKLEEGNLFKLTIIKLSEIEHIIILSFHHIVMDGWSLQLILSELSHNYNCYISGKEKKNDHLPLQYFDYAQNQNRNFNRHDISVVMDEYWKNKLKDAPLLHSLPIDFERPSVFSFEGETEIFVIDKEIYSKLKLLGQENKTTLYTILLVSYAILIAKSSNENDILISSPTANRTELNMELMIGHFIISRVNRIKVLGDVSFNELVQLINKEMLEENRFPLIKPDRIVEILKLERNPSYHPLCQLVLAFQNFEKRNYNFIGLEVEDMRLKKKFTLIDLDLHIKESDNELLGSFLFNKGLFKQESIKSLIEHYLILLKEIVTQPNLPISMLSILTNNEVEKLLITWNNTKKEPLQCMKIQELFEKRAILQPNSIALIFGDKYLTYAKLNQESNKFANYLRSKGVYSGINVGICIDRSADLIINILAVLKAGGTYLPIDLDYCPVDRLLAVIEESNLSIILTKEKLLDRIPLNKIKCINNYSEYLETKTRVQIKNINILPFPNITYIDFEKYRQYSGITVAKNSISLYTSRGCPYKCIYCHKIWPKSHVFRSAENIFEEVKTYYNLGIRRFSIVDDIFNLNQKNSSEFFKLIIKNKLDIQIFFGNGLRGDILKKEYIDLMIEAGVSQVTVALETGSPRLQRLIKKNINIDNLKENILYICEHYPQVFLQLFTMLGFPTETEEEALMTLNFIKDIKWLDFPYINILKIFPNTDMEELALSSGIRKKDIERSFNMAYYEFPYTLPYSKEFVMEYRTNFTKNYFLLKDRLKNRIPYQLKHMTIDSLVQLYGDYFQTKFDSFGSLLDYFKIDEKELNNIDDNMAFSLEKKDGFNKKAKEVFPQIKSSEEAIKILLLDLSQTFDKNNDAMYKHIEYPLGLMYLLSYLHKEYNDKVNGKIAKPIIDFNNYIDLKRLINEFNPDIIGIRTLSYYNRFFQKSISIIKQWFPNIPIITGGPHATSNYNEIIKDPNIDIVVIGEGEETFSEIIGLMIQNKNNLPSDYELRNVNGIIFKKKIKDYDPIQIISFDNLYDDLDKYSLTTPVTDNSLNNPAYIMFTSGSTSRPKGVQIKHKGIVNLVDSQIESFNIKQKSILLQFASISFDASVSEIFTALSSGAILVMASKDNLVPGKPLKNTIDNYNITTVTLPPSILSVYDKDEFSNLETLIVAGEPCSENIYKKWSKKLKFINAYGPTEVTVCATINSNLNGEEPLSIGRPINNTKIYVLDNNMQLVPIGVPGELYIEGVGLADGYINQIELTREKFLANPFSESSGSVFYKTGDIVKYLPNGNLIFIKRVDEQIKIRGFRIELDEIKNNILKFSGIQDASVIAKGNSSSNSYLEAFIVKSESITELWPSTAEFFVYDEMLYYAMTNDLHRNEAYRRTINKYVKDKVVIDVGTGKDAILSRFCVEGGAKRVYAIEILESSYLSAKRIISELGLNGKIIMIHGNISEIELPEKVDICVSEIVGSIGGAEGAEILLDIVRKKFIKPKGIMIPQKSITKIAAIKFPDDIHSQPYFKELQYQYSNKIFNQVGKKFDLRICIKNFSKSNIISNSNDFEILDFSEKVKGNTITNLKFTINKNSRLDGFIIWLNLHLDNKEVIDILENQYCWLPIFIPVFYPGKEVKKDDCIKLTVYRNLNENMLNPDFLIKGQLIILDKEIENFEYDLSHICNYYKSSLFFERLFENSDSKWGSINDNLIDELKRFMGLKLPSYMIPSNFYILNELPINSNGKVDKIKLKEFSRDKPKSKIKFPSTNIESEISDIWKEILGVSQLSIKQNFFSLGGNSILIPTLINMLEKKLNVNLEIVDIFKYPTIETLSVYISNSIKKDTSPQNKKQNIKISVSSRISNMKKLSEIRNKKN